MNGRIVRRALACVVWVAASVPTGAHADPLVIDSRRLFDGTEIIEHARLVVEDGRVVAVGPRSKLHVAPGMPIQDRTREFIIPGLVAAHSHVGMVAGLEHGGRHYSRATVLRDLQQFRRYGVTLVNALGLNPPLFYTLRREFRGAGHDGADLFGAGPGIGAANGLPPAAGMHLEPDQVARPTSAEAARRAVARMADRGVDAIKLWVDDGAGRYPVMPAAIYQAAIDAAHRRGLPAIAHIHDLEHARALVLAGIDVIGHGVRDQPVDQPFIDALLAGDVGYIPTLNISEAAYLYAEHPEWADDPFLRAGLSEALREAMADPAWRRSALSGSEAARAELAMNLRNLRTLHAAGVRIGFGTDSGATALRVPGLAEHLEMQRMADAGMDPLEVLAAATRVSADLLDLKDRGRLVPDSIADFVVLTEDPTRDIRHSRSIVEVWRYGRLAVDRRNGD